MKNLKKGDWVVTPYDKYPIQLEEDSKDGVFEMFLSGIHFFTCSEEEAYMMNMPHISAVRDPRNGILGSEGYFPTQQVRHATKKDLKLLIDIANKNIKKSEKKLKLYSQAVRELK